MNQEVKEKIISILDLDETATDLDILEAVILLKNNKPTYTQNPIIREPYKIGDPITPSPIDPWTKPRETWSDKTKPTINLRGQRSLFEGLL